jgi:CHAD domain-containing protein
MSMKNKIRKRLAKLNAFLDSNKKPGLKIIHALRLEVKQLEAFLELMSIQDNFGARTEIPGRLEKLFHEAGKLRKFGLAIKAIQSITDHNRLSKPTLFLQQIRLSEKKSDKKLRKKQRTYPAFKPGDFVKHPGVRLSSDTWQRFLADRASSILNLLKQDILADIRSLHQLRKILKSILYVLPVYKKGEIPVRVFLKTRKRFMQSVESKIGSLHDTDFFITWLEKKQNLIDAGEEAALKKIKREWQHDMMGMRKDLKPLLPSVRQFALDLKDQSTGDLNTARMLPS